MQYLVDTNVLLRWVRPQADFSGMARGAIDTLQARGEELLIVPQVVVEFWCVATRPVSANGFGLAPQEVDESLRFVETLFELLPDVPGIHDEWRRLVRAYGVSGVQVHDARLVAAMRVHGISHILTLNDADFERYAGIISIHRLK